MAPEEDVVVAGDLDMYGKKSTKKRAKSWKQRALRIL